MAFDPRVPCVQGKPLVKIGMLLRMECFNVTGTPQTVVDEVCGGNVPPITSDGTIGAVAIAGSESCSVGYSGTYYLVPDLLGAADATYAWVLTPVLT